MGKVMKRSAIGLLLFATLLSVFITSCSRNPNIRKQKYLESGKKYYEKAKYREAAIQFSNALQVDPRFADAHYQLAQTYLKMGSYPAAYQELRRTVDLQPDNTRAQLDIGNLLLAGRQFDEAEKHAQGVLDKHPGDADAHALLANVREAKGDADAALQEIRKAIELSPNRAQFYMNLGLFLANAKQFSEAEAADKKAFELDPKSSRPLLAMASLYAGQQRWSDAEQVLQKAVSVEPNSVEPRIILARFYLGEQKKDRAEQTLAEAKKAMPDDATAYRLLGDFYAATGDLDKAIAEYASLFDQHPNDLPLKKTYISALLQKGRTADVTRLNDEILKKNPKDVEAQIIRGRVLIGEKKGSDAIQALDTAVKIEPDNAGGHYYLALASDLTGDTTRRETELREAVRLRPDFLPAETALGAVAMQKGDWATLNSAGAAVIRMQPNAPQGYVMRAISEVGRKDTVAAESDFNRAIEVAPKDPIGYVRLGEFRLTQGRSKDADRLLEQALDLNPGSAQALRLLMASYAMQKLPLPRMVARISAQIAKSPNNSAFYALLGAAEAQARDFVNAELHLQKALQLDANDLSAFTVLAQVQIASGNGDKAMATYEAWAKQSPRDPRPLLMIGTLQQGKNDWQKAQEAYQKALQVAPDYPLAANNLAYVMLLHGGNPDVALSLAQTAHRGMPDSPNAADTLAYAYLQKGAYDSAVGLLEEAIQKDPNNATFEYHLALAYERMNEFGRARQHLQKALQLNPKFPDAEAARALMAKLR
jgi:tetratricopeptide (TPR) repeat protein